MSKLFKILIFSVLLLTTACNKSSKLDPNRPIGAEDKRRKNIEEGRGASLKGIIQNRGSTNYEFSSSNPMWRASLETLDFLPLTTVDYSGGVIITDWYSTANNESERCKLNIFIIGMSLKAENLKVTSFCQEFKSQIWVNKNVDKENNIKIENAILNKAKKLRLQLS